uniref:Retrovirus-related Pol polyprotein from transposon TNT 1-94 n=1 Tax=Tanacetum cinerariifolium TaxID=118510 RepID=A0A6L2NP73_TANCI|nr:retrovirus-related Pol polyprotein from transposon TNT 1-94 [Tanacetum cinerariifolium]
MDSLRPQVIFAAKLPILNPNEFDLWKMRIEQYFLMTDYSLWEAILNGDSPVPTRVVEGILQPVAPTTVEQKLAKKNELKARDVNLQFLRSLPSEWKTHTLIWRNKDDLEEQSLDDLFNSLKIMKLKLSTLLQIDVDDLEEMDLKWQMAMLTMRARRFLQKTGRNLGANGPTSMGFDMFQVESYNCHRKGHFAIECRSPKDSRRNRAAKPQKRTVPVETSTSNALVSQCDEVGSYYWSYQAEEEPASYALMAFSSLSSSSDNEVPSCLKACSKAYAQLHSQFDNLTDDFRISQFDVISYQTGLESVEARLLVYKQNESIFGENIKLLNIEVELRDNALVTLRQKLEKAKQERDELKLKLEKFQTSSKNLTELLAKSDCESWPLTSLYDKFQPSDGYHVVPPPYTGTFMPPKPNLVFNTTPTVVETDHPAFTVQISPTKPEQALSHTNRPTSPIIEDWHVETSISAATPKPKIAQPTPRNHAHRGHHKQYAPLTNTNPQKHMAHAAVLTQSKPVSITVVRPVSTDVPKIKVTQPRHANLIVTKSKSPIRRHVTRSASPKTSNSPPKVTTVKAPGNPQHTLKDKGVIDSGCSRHMTGNMSYLFDFEELNGGYVAFGGNPKSGKISGKGKIKTCKQHRASCKTKPVSSVNQPLYRLRMDLFGPTFVKSLNKKSYYLVVPDDYNREFSVPRTPQQNGIAERKNRTLIEAARTMLADSLLPITFWAEAVNTACYVQNRVLVTKPHNKTPYELLHGRTPSIGFMRPSGCHVTILNTIDSLGKIDRKVDEGFLIGYPVSSKAFRVFNSRTHIVQETLHVHFLENKPNVADSGPTWLFDIDSLTRTMNYQPVTAGNQTNPSAGFQDKFDVEKVEEEIDQQYVLFPMWSSGFTNPHNNDEDATFDGKEHDFDVKKHESEVSVSPSSRYKDLSAEFEDCSDNSINEVNAAEDITYSDDEDDVGAEADFNNLETSITISPILTTRVHKDHHVSQIIGDLSSTTQTRRFDDPDYPDKVYKVVKALYGLHQAPRAWYETLANYLLENGFQRGKIDQTMFIKRQKGDILMVNDVTRLQALVDRKKCMSAKRTSWNEFSSLMASAVICLSFGDLLTHTTTCTSPTLTQKVFANMRRVGKGFSGVETPLFEGMLVEQKIDEEGDAAEHVKEVNTGDAAEGDDSAAHGEVPTVAEEESILSPTPPTPPPQPP